MPRGISARSVDWRRMVDDLLATGKRLVRAVERCRFVSSLSSCLICAVLVLPRFGRVRNQVSSIRAVHVVPIGTRCTDRYTCGTEVGTKPLYFWKRPTLPSLLTWCDSGVQQTLPCKTHLRQPMPSCVFCGRVRVVPYVDVAASPVPCQEKHGSLCHSLAQFSDITHFQQLVHSPNGGFYLYSASASKWPQWQHARAG